MHRELLCQLSVSYHIFEVCWVTENAQEWQKPWECKEIWEVCPFEKGRGTQRVCVCVYNISNLN